MTKQFPPNKEMVESLANLDNPAIAIVLDVLENLTNWYEVAREYERIEDIDKYRIRMAALFVVVRELYVKFIGLQNQDDKQEE